MLGAIIGDIVGSRFEFNNHLSKDFDLFAEGCFATDDSIMSLAVAKAIMDATKAKTAISRGYDDPFYSQLSDLTVKHMQEIGRKYPNCGFGGMFYQWVFSDNPEPYDSFGNGAAMRVSPAGFAATTEWEAEHFAEAVTEVTHNHEEGIKGAKATAVAIVMARQGALKSEIRERMIADYYPLDFRIDDIRSSYRFNETCQETVPQAIECFLESTSFEDAIRTAISLGGDSDTIASITGAIAEGYYGIPDAIKEKALGYLDEELRVIYDEWEQFAPSDSERFKVLTKYIGKISAAASLGEWIVDTENDGTPEHPVHFPFVNYSGLVVAFEEEFYQFSEEHPEYELTRYGEILDKNGLKWGSEEMSSANLETLDEQGVLALIMGAIRAERFCDGALLGFLKDGSLTRWLKRLKDIDWQYQEREVAEIEFEDGGFFGGYTTYRLTFDISGAEMSQSHGFGEAIPFDKKTYSIKEADALRGLFASIHTEYWNASYPNPCVCDGEQWSLTVRYANRNTLEYSGSNAYPENWNDILEFFGIDHDEDEDNPDGQTNELIYCSVSFGESSETYYYTTDDDSIKVGDRVIVPVGANYIERTGTVKNIELFALNSVPFPINKTKSIISKIDESEYENKLSDDIPDEPAEPIGEILDLSEADTTVHFSINGFGNGLDGNDISECWCLVSICVTNKYFSYEKQNDEMFDFGELLDLQNKVNKAVHGKLTKLAWVDFMEPDIDFFIENEHGKIRLNLSGCNTQYYTIPLYKEDVKHLKQYLDSRVILLRKQWQENHVE